ncbi:hypothetical protein RRF57_008950 [Xylaria bambusicola]|uniref:SET domain-containing protein n=1 Tax=Xylaria bambusicola TaxID=326684 RepID=A0AAN7UW53_9PEZI
MSDISATPDDDRPYEVRSAGHKGLGAFASRDIEPGEVVIVEYTPIILDETEDKSKDCFAMARLYETLEEGVKKGWRSLHASTSPYATFEYRQIFSSPQPDGSVLSEEKQELYTMLRLQCDANRFGTGTNQDALFIEVSRFNHSVSPFL